MLTKYILTIGETEYEIPDECLKNWDQISFKLKRTDYSGVMRSFSTEFVFVGEIYDLLFAEYLDKGFLAQAKVAVYTITDRHMWEKQYEATLDFSTIEIEEGSLSINAMDNALGSMLKSKRGQKYEYAVSDFDTVDVNVGRIEITNYAYYSFPVVDTRYTDPDTYMTALLNDTTSQIISSEYLELCDEIWNYEGADNRFFGTVKQNGFMARLTLTGYVRCWFCPYKKTVGANPGDDIAVTNLTVTKIVEASGGGNTETHVGTLASDNLQQQVIHGVPTNILVNETKGNVFASVTALNARAIERFGQNGAISNDYNGIFGVVGSVTDYTSTTYWQNNDIYEWQNGRWLNKGKAEDYFQDRSIAKSINGYNGKVSVSLTADVGAVLCLKPTGRLYMQYASMRVEWADPIHDTLTVRGITPQQLISKIVSSITGEQSTVTIAEDDAGLLANTVLVPGEELRKIPDAKIYGTFQSFAEWMEAVFGYTYRIEGDELQFVHRSEAFVDEVTKTVTTFRDVKFSIVDDLIYTEVDAGYSKKEYGEIDGRLEKNFTNYYSTGYALTDKKCSLISKYRADSYGIEFTARKSESETTDDKSDEDIFVLRYVTSDTTGINNYQPAYNDSYNPAVCVDNNQGFIAVFGNGKAVSLTMTSSDGNNTLEDVDIDAGVALFTAAELEFYTDDMKMPDNLNALIEIEYDGFVYTGYIKESEARFGRTNGTVYTLIVKDITAI